MRLNVNIVLWDRMMTAAPDLNALPTLASHPEALNVDPRSPGIFRLKELFGGKKVVCTLTGQNSNRPSMNSVIGIFKDVFEVPGKFVILELSVHGKPTVLNFAEVSSVSEQ